MNKKVTNLDQKRVCDITADKKTVVIHKKGCITWIKANPNGTLRITHERIKLAT